MRQKLSYDNIFLIDGIGALLTATLLSQVLARWVPVFGMPQAILYVLAGLAGGFAVYSLACHFWLQPRRAAFLKGIALANTLYCVLTLGLVICLSGTLTPLGIVYFLGEIMVVMGLVSLEAQLIKSGAPQG